MKTINVFEIGSLPGLKHYLLYYFICSFSFTCSFCNEAGLTEYKEKRKMQNKNYFLFYIVLNPHNAFLWRSISISISNTHLKEKINSKWLFGPKFLEITSVSHRICLQTKHFSSRLNPESSETATYKASPHFEFQIHFSRSQNSSITWSLRDKAVAFANGPICLI